MDTCTYIKRKAKAKRYWFEKSCAIWDAIKEKSQILQYDEE